MTAPDKPDLARGWLRAERLLDKEADRIATMSDEEFEREMGALPEPAHVPTADEVRVRSAERARELATSEDRGRGATVKALPVSKRVSHRMIWLVAAALGVLVVVGVMRRREVIAWFKGDNTIGPDLELEKALVQRRADDFRRQGLDACADSRWTICQTKLDEAKTLDPAGEADGHVKAARQSIDDARRPAPVLPRTPDTK